MQKTVNKPSPVMYGGQLDEVRLLRKRRTAPVLTGAWTLGVTAWEPQAGVEPARVLSSEQRVRPQGHRQATRCHACLWARCIECLLWVRLQARHWGCHGERLDAFLDFLELAASWGRLGLAKVCNRWPGPSGGSWRSAWRKRCS